MLIILLDEPGLFVFPTVNAAEREIEPYDADLVRGAFDDSGVPYRFDWIRPKSHRKILFGLLSSEDPGEYRLVRAGPVDLAAFARFLEAHPAPANSAAAAPEFQSLRSRSRAGRA
jgi:hypothetical protein